MKKTSSIIQRDIPIPKSFNYQEFRDINFDQLWKFTNHKYFYRKFLGYPGNIDRGLENREPKAIELYKKVEKMKKKIKHGDLMKPIIGLQFFPCHSSNDCIILEYNNEEYTFSLPRQSSEPFSCLSDYISPDNDSIAIFVATSGREILDHVKHHEDEGKFTDAFILQSLSISAAEGLAELAHHKIRQQWGIERSDINGYRLSRDYQGKRYSFGYPACPDMSDQQVIWELLSPETRLGVKLTETYMMEPEASVSGLVFHASDALYFSV